VIDPGQVVELGKTYEFKIISIEPDIHRLGLSLKALSGKNKEEKKEKEEETVETEAKTESKKVKKETKKSVKK
ncbi:MAG TPA: hypothetical protein PLQ70_06555, partial [Flavobacterium alvei]|nr:hypothetical protein [Flavobacterium alvei]